MQCPVLTDKLQRHAPVLIPKGRRQPFQRIFPVIDPMRHVGKRYPRMSRQGAHGKRPFPVIPQIMTGVFHGECIQKRNSLPVIFRRHKRRLTNAHQVGQIIIPELSAVIDMPQKVLYVHHADTVACTGCIQLKNTILFVVGYIHSFRSLSVLLKRRLYVIRPGKRTPDRAFPASDKLLSDFLFHGYVKPFSQLPVFTDFSLILPVTH